MHTIILPTQNPPDRLLDFGEFNICPYKRVGITEKSSVFYLDSIKLEVLNDDWNLIKKWVIFHSLIFDDSHLLVWFEKEYFTLSSLFEDGECTTKEDYLDISNSVYFGYKYPNSLIYKDLYEDFLKLDESDYGLIKNYLSVICYEKNFSLQRQITDNSYWDIVRIYSILESILGSSPKCIGKLKCDIHNEIVLKHNQFSNKNWLDIKLTEIISDDNVKEEYLEIILGVHNFIRNPTVHKSDFPTADFILGEVGDTVFDNEKILKDWEADKTALYAMKLNILEIVRNLLLYKVLRLTMFNPIRPLHSTRIVT
jgi:hypothetical protein